MCSICSCQLNIWHARHVLAPILNWFLQSDLGIEACFSQVKDCPGIALPPGTVHFSNKTASNSYLEEFRGFQWKRPERDALSKRYGRKWKINLLVYSMRSAIWNVCICSYFSNEEFVFSRHAASIRILEHLSMTLFPLLISLLVLFCVLKSVNIETGKYFRRYCTNTMSCKFVQEMLRRFHRVQNTELVSFSGI